MRSRIAKPVLNAFRGNPKRGTEYCGEIAKLSILFNHADEARDRAICAAHFAYTYIRSKGIGKRNLAAHQQPK